MCTTAKNILRTVNSSFFMTCILIFTEKVLYCEICQYDKIFVDARMWCTECLELYCSLCYKVHSRSRIGREHRTESINKYLKKLKVIANISTSCQEHSKKLIMYCSNHDLPICYACTNKHEKCTLEYIPKIFKEEEMSAKFENVKKRTSNFLEHIAVLLSKVEKENSSITKKRDDFVQSVDACVNKMLKKTDRIKENGLKDLESHCNKMVSTRNHLEVVWISICCIKQQLANLKLNDADSQTFLSFLAMQKDLQKYESQLKKTVYGNQMEVINPTINFPCDEVTYERNVRPLSPNRELTITSSTQQTKDLQLQDYVMFEIPKGKFTNHINGSTFLSNDSICFSDSRNNRLILKSVDGTYETFDLPFTPVCVSTISNSKVAISFKSSLGIVDVKEKSMDELKFTKSERFGCILYNNDNILVHVCEYGFYIVNIQGEKIKDIHIPGSVLSCFSSWKDEIYCTFKNESLLCCFNLQSGNLSWTQNVSKLKKPPAGITCDQNGVLFIAGSFENNIVAVTTFDRNYKELIKGIKSMKKPSTISFDLENRRLLVCSEFGKVVIYSINSVLEKN